LNLNEDWHILTNAVGDFRRAAVECPRSTAQSTLETTLAVVLNVASDLPGEWSQLAKVLQPMAANTKIPDLELGPSPDGRAAGVTSTP
jgi:hypothetical protein